MNQKKQWILKIYNTVEKENNIKKMNIEKENKRDKWKNKAV